MGLRESFVHQPELDPSKVGLSFIDLLFAAVVPFQLMALDHWWQLRPVGWIQLSTSVVLLLTSWIGYHNSSSRSGWRIAFVNLPLVIFVLDVLMVLVYGFSAFAAQIGARTGSPNQCSPVPMDTAVALTFALYVLWDFVNLRLKQAEKYQKAWKLGHGEANVRVRELSDIPWRRKVTWGCLAISVAILTISAFVDSMGHPAARTIVADLLLVLLLVGFRLAKELRGAEPRRPKVFVPASSAPGTVASPPATSETAPDETFDGADTSAAETGHTDSDDPKSEP